MDAIVIDSISFQPDFDLLTKLLRIDKEGSYFEDFKAMVEEAKTIGRPKAIYKVSYIEHKGDDFVVIDGHTFKSRVLRVNLDQIHRVFPFIVTGGIELERWLRSFEDTLKQYWAEAINGMALLSAIKALDAHLEEKYRPGKIAFMTPGSLEDWPITEQKTLFALLGDTRKLIGVELMKSCLMVPTKTVSGIRFPTEKSFQNCQLCPREDCPGRRAPYDKDLYDREYKPK